MAEIRPFRGLRYDISRIADINRVICPPYDVISPTRRTELHELDKYNYVRLESGREFPADSDSDSKFTRAAATLKAWRQEGVLRRDDAPAIYLHDHHFTLKEKTYRRRGIIATVKLEEWDKMVVRPHEGTFARPKSERLSLMWAAAAGISPIMTLYSDPGGDIAALLNEAAARPPDLAGDWYEGEKHELWALTDPGLLANLAGCFEGEPVYIADGHHRYESALAYRRERQACQPDAPADAPWNYVLMTLLDFADPGLVVLPPHRLVRGLSPAQLEGMAGGLGSFFEVAELPLEEAGSREKIAAFLEEGKVSQDRLALGGLKPGKALTLRLKDRVSSDKMMPAFHSEAYRRLSVSVVDHVILEKLLGVASGDQEERLAYDTDMEAVMGRVAAGEYQLALLLPPVATSVIRDIADAKDRMPRKATYFYPKLPSGLVTYSFE